MKKILSSLIITSLLIMGLTKVAYCQKDQLEQVWYNGEKTSKIEIYKGADGTYCGKVTWLKDSLDKETGKPRLDKENPDEKLRGTRILNLVIMKGFKKTADNANEYKEGTIYDPKNGKTYCGKITFKGKSLDLRGYYCSFSLLGRTETWELAGQ